ncbi:MAG TPA: DNA ligase D [Aliidongia sp.]|nr:DNA ligase D [Aliidongia sp.]
MALETYRKKRNFTATSEPAGSDEQAPAGDSFVIQKHDARRLHYDFRLEMDGVLKSWAVAKGPSLVPGEKRLAVHVEDHPLEYGGFEGTIPKGEYGGGTVIVWDRGRWTPIGDAAKGYAKGHLDFDLKGEKLSGRWHLVRMKGKPREKRENWLLIKGDDEAARPDGADILEERPESVKTGREIADVAGETPGWSSRTGKIEKASHSLDPAGVKKATEEKLPDFVPPALATLVAKAPAGKRWLHEIKFDGYRLQARIEAGRVKLLTRTGLDWTDRFGKEIVGLFKALPVGTALIDGELVVENDHGASDFSALQADLSEGRGDRFVFYAFDLLHLDGWNLRAVPLIERKRLLEKLLADQTGKLRFSASFDEDGDVILQHACRLSLEGLVSKLRDAPYRSGRGKDWVKSKCSTRQEFVIGGYVPSTTSRKAIGSLVMGYHEGGKLVHAGRVGTGYTMKVAEELFQRLEKLRTDESPFAAKLTAEEARQVRYVRPELVAEVEFRAWTADHHLRHAAFRGLREDKPAAEIVREAPAETVPPAKPQRPLVKLTHPDRLYWPDAGVTKEGLADYYTEVWRWIAPFIVGRPLALVRCPGGISGQCFFQKHAWQGVSTNIRLVRDPKDEAAEPNIVIGGLDGLIGLVQAGVLEIHPWGSALATLEQPDQIIMDLDPGEGIVWDDIIAAAIEVRDRLKDLGLTSFVKTSGGKGLHVVAPLVPAAGWDPVKQFTKDLADAMAADSPDRYVATVTKSKRQGKILLDYLRNGRGNTAVAPYSTRARPGASVSMPLAWDELGAGIGPAYFTVMNTPSRLAHLGADPWRDFRNVARPLPDGGK